MFYGRGWDVVSLDEFMKEVDDYLAWYCNGRINTALGNVTPVEYRQKAAFSL